MVVAEACDSIIQDSLLHPDRWDAFEAPVYRTLAPSQHPAYLNRHFQDCNTHRRGRLYPSDSELVRRSQLPPPELPNDIWHSPGCSEHPLTRGALSGAYPRTLLLHHIFDSQKPSGQQTVKIIESRAILKDKDLKSEFLNYYSRMYSPCQVRSVPCKSVINRSRTRNIRAIQVNQ